MRKLLIAVLLVAAITESALANNTDFLPGDSFFFTRLNSSEIEALQGTDAPILRYRSHWNGGRGCGSAGFQFLEITQMPEAEKACLASAFQKLEQELERDEDDNKTISVLICNGDYDWQRFGIALQYNENWADETAAFGHLRQHLVLESFIGTHENGADGFIERNWRDSSLVTRLNVVSPPIGEKTISHAPVKMQSPRLYVVLPNREFRSYVSPEEGTRILIIADGELAEMTFTKRKWQTK